MRDPAYVYVRHEDEPTAPPTADPSARASRLTGCGSSVSSIRLVEKIVLGFVIALALAELSAVASEHSFSHDLHITT